MDKDLRQDGFGISIDDPEYVVDVLTNEYGFSKPDDNGEYIFIGHDEADSIARVYDRTVEFTYNDGDELSDDEYEENMEHLQYAFETIADGRRSPVDIDAVLNPQPGAWEVVYDAILETASDRFGGVLTRGSPK